MFLVMGSCFGIAAAALLGGAVWAYVTQQRTMSDRAEATGTVMELVSRTTASARSNMICPVVEFTTPAGDKVRFTSDFGSLPARHTVGQRVNVRYDVVDPHKAEIDSAMSLWLTPLILVFMGVIACCLAVSFLATFWFLSPSVSP